MFRLANVTNYLRIPHLYVPSRVKPLIGGWKQNATNTHVHTWKKRTPGKFWWKIHFAFSTGRPVLRSARCAAGFVLWEGLHAKVKSCSQLNFTDGPPYPIVSRKVKLCWKLLSILIWALFFFFHNRRLHFPSTSYSCRVQTLQIWHWKSRRHDNENRKLMNNMPEAQDGSDLPPNRKSLRYSCLGLSGRHLDAFWLERNRDSFVQMGWCVLVHVNRWRFRFFWGESPLCNVTIFRPSATVSRIGLMESRLRRRCRCHGCGPPHTPLAGCPPSLASYPPCDGWLGRSASVLTKRTCVFFRNVTFLCSYSREIRLPK